MAAKSGCRWMYRCHDTNWPAPSLDTRSRPADWAKCLVPDRSQTQCPLSPNSHKLRLQNPPAQYPSMADSTTLSDWLPDKIAGCQLHWYQEIGQHQCQGSPFAQYWSMARQHSLISAIDRCSSARPLPKVRPYC